jgi:hypothetical protein
MGGEGAERPVEHKGMIMTRYLLSTHTVDDEQRQPMSEEQMRAMGQRLAALEQEMDANGAWVFSARLHGPETATVVRATEGDLLTTDGPFAETKEHLAGFYIIDAEGLDTALRWAAKVSETIGRPIEVRPFAGFSDQPDGAG